MYVWWVQTQNQSQIMWYRWVLVHRSFVLPSQKSSHEQGRQDCRAQAADGCQVWELSVVYCRRHRNVPWVPKGWHTGRKGVKAAEETRHHRGSRGTIQTESARNDDRAWKADWSSQVCSTWACEVWNGEYIFHRHGGFDCFQSRMRPMRQQGKLTIHLCTI